MAEETPVEATETKDPVKGGEPKSDPSSGQTFTLEQMREEAEKLAAKRTEEYERKIKRLSRDFEDFRKEKETEDEKAERERKERLLKQEEELSVKHERRGELIGALMAKGKSMDQAKELANYAQNFEWSDPDKAIKELSARLGVTFDSTRPGGGGGNAPRAEDSDLYSPEGVKKARESMGPMEFASWYKEHRDEIHKAQKAWISR